MKLHPNGDRTLLPGTKPVKHKTGKSFRASKQSAPAQPPLPNEAHAPRPPILPPPSLPAAVVTPQTLAPLTLGEVAWQNRAWPRMFTLPGIKRYLDYDAETLCAHLASAFLDFQAELHELVATAAQTRPDRAAALAEAVTILEQCASMEGFATELDHTPSNGESPLLRLAALAKVQALNKGKGGTQQ